MPTRQLYWNITWHWLLYPLFAVALAVFAYGFYRRWRLWQQGKPGKREHQFWSGVADVLTFGFGHKRIASEPYPGIMHVLIFWGAVLLAFATAIVALQADFGIAVFRGDLYLFIKATTNLFGLLVLVGISMAGWRRYVTKAKKLDTRADDAVTLALLAVILITGFLIEAARMAAVPDPWAKWGFVGYWLSGPLGATFSQSGLLIFHRALWWFHLSLTLGLVAYLAYSKLIHVFLAPANQFMRPRGAIGVPESIDFEDESIESYGIAALPDLPRKTLFDTDVCLRCGRCQDNCPATASGKHLNPKTAIQDIRAFMVETGRQAQAASAASGKAGKGRDGGGRDRALIGDVILEKDVWSCTTCRACEAACPVFVGHVDTTLEMRRNLVLMESRFPSQARLIFDNMEVNANPLGESALVRGDHLRKLGVPTIAEKPKAEILYWPGCAGALDVRNQKTSAALVRLMQSAGVSFATLGNEEKCCGEPARRLGNEYLFQTLARGNIEVMDGYRVRKIVTQCPHCFNTLKNEYPQFGGNFEVLHHTEFLLQLVAGKRLRLGTGVRKRIAYHDSCYLGRYNGMFQQPRELLKAAGLDLAEMPRARAKAFCCGGGGGRMWLEEDEGERINNLRVDEILGVSPDVVAVACPYCLTMLRDGVDARGAGERLKVMDIADILDVDDESAPQTVGDLGLRSPALTEERDAVAVGAHS
jgi:Fe-S oxidoreductase/nitrate reductase gamma subunit